MARSPVVAAPVGKTAARGLAALAGGIALAILAPVAAVRADQIDGEWCATDGRIMSIEGPRMVTPGGKRILGDYTRHTLPLHRAR